MMKRPVKLSKFSKKVMALVKKIPKGKVASYGQIATLAGKSHGARGVGWILNSSSEIYHLPWQRVVNSRGRISFRKNSPEFRTQKNLLTKEKVKFRDDGSIDLEKYGWKVRIRLKSESPSMFS